MKTATILSAALFASAGAVLLAAQSTPGPASGPTTQPSLRATASAWRSTPGVPTVLEPTGAALHGLAQPSKQVVLMAPLDGIVRKVLVEEGEVVQEGQVLAEMDDKVQKAATESARLQAEALSDVKQAELVLAESQITLERLIEAFDKQAANEWEVRREKLRRDQAEAALQASKEKLAVAQANHKLEQEKLAHFKLHAPFTGRIIRKQVESGATLSHTDPVLTMAALDPLEAQVHLPVERYGQIKVGQKHRLRAEAPVGGELTGTVKTIDPVIDPASRTFRVVFTLPNPDQKLPAGFTVTVVGP